MYGEKIDMGMPCEKRKMVGEKERLTISLSGLVGCLLLAAEC
jgi:hypothetical protein